MALDFPKWLKDEMGMTDEEVALHQGTLGAIFTPERQAKLETGYANAAQLASLTAAHQAKVTADQERLTQAQQQLDDQILAWGQQENLTKAQREKLEQDYARAAANVAALTATLRTTAMAAGVADVDAIVNAALQAAPGGAGTPAPVVNPPAGAPNTMPPTFDPKQFIPAEMLPRMMNVMVAAPAVYAQIGREYHALTGEFVDETKLATELQRRMGDPRNQKSLELKDIYEEMYDVPAKRAAAEQKRIDGLIAAARAEGHQAGLSEAALPGSGQMHNSMPVGHHSPVLAAAAGRTPAMQRPGFGAERNAGAVAAFQSGKYRQPVPGAPQPGQPQARAS